MKKTEIRTRSVNIQNVIEQTCDFCGKTAKANEIEFSDITEFKIAFGYGSKHDGDEYGFDICDDCFDILLKNKTYEG